MDRGSGFPLPTVFLLLLQPPHLCVFRALAECIPPPPPHPQSLSTPQGTRPVTLLLRPTYFTPPRPWWAGGWQLMGEEKK